MGFIVPVEPFKETGVVDALAFLVIVRDGDGDILLRARCRDGDGAALVAVLDGIVEEDMDEFVHALPVAHAFQSFRAGDGEFLAAVFYKKVEFTGRRGKEFLHIKRLYLELQAAHFTCLGKKDEVIDKVGEVAHLF